MRRLEMPTSPRVTCFSAERCRRAAIACLAVVLCACPKVTIGDGSSAADDGQGGAPSGACSPLSGVYRFSYELRSGSCGELPDEVLEFVQGRLQSTATHSCQAGGVVMIRPCDLQLDRRCSVSDPLTGALLGSTRVKGVLSEPRDNTRAQGTIELVITDTSGGTCSAQYAVEATRID